MTYTEHSEQDIKSMLNNTVLQDPDMTKFIIRVWNFAKKSHGDQRRRSGEPHTEHLFETAKKLSELSMDTTTIAAGILHDTIEDTEVTESILKQKFGVEIASLVVGVTKLKNHQHSASTYQAENLRRLFIAAAKDPRVLIIKLCDRLHNMYTLQFLSPNRRIYIARETLNIYVPIADRLGINGIKRELEDLAFLHIEPSAYKKNEQLFEQCLLNHQHAVTEAMILLLKHLISSCRFSIQAERRLKGKYSFYRKLARKKGNLKEINDIITLQVIVPQIEDCYITLGNVHALWRPIPGKMKDYIAFPKPNNYQCLRTAVLSDSFGIIEVQIYSTDMYKHAQYGLASEFISNESTNHIPVYSHPRKSPFHFLEKGVLDIINLLYQNRKLNHEA